MEVKFNDIQSQFTELKGELMPAIEQVMMNGDFILGSAVKNFEDQFAQYSGSKYVVGVDNGTNAISLALETLGIGEGDDVIVPANTFFADAIAVSGVGANIVLCDVDYATQLMAASDIEKVITPRTECVIVVALFGQMPEMAEILELQKKRDFKIISDCSQAQGALYHWKKTGQFGDIITYSFYPAKNLGAIGDAGAIGTDNEDYYNHLIKLRNYGSTKKYYHDFIGRNARLDTINSAVLSVKLNHLDKWNARRNEVAAKYNEKLSGIIDLIIPAIAQKNFSVQHIYPVKTKRRDELQAFLTEHGIGTGIHYPVPIHKQEAYREYDFGSNNSFPVTEQLSNEILSLPMHQYVTGEQIDHVCKIIKRFFSKKKIYCFYHIMLKHHFVQIVNEQMNTLITSGLYDEAAGIYVGALGDRHNCEVLKNVLLAFPKAQLIYYSENTDEFELATMRLIEKKVADEEEPFYALYFHGKGVSYPSSMRKAYTGGTYWRNHMNYWNIKRWKDAVQKLNDGHDTCGVKLQYATDPPAYQTHYSGTFWWATSDYLKKLPKISSLKITDRFQGEFWIGMANPNAASLSQEWVDYNSQKVWADPSI